MFGVVNPLALSSFAFVETEPGRGGDVRPRTPAEHIPMPWLGPSLSATHAATSSGSGTGMWLARVWRLIKVFADLLFVLIGRPVFGFTFLGEVVWDGVYLLNDIV